MMSYQNYTSPGEDSSDQSHLESEKPEIQYRSGITEGLIEEWIAHFRPSQIRYIQLILNKIFNFFVKKGKKKVIF